MYLVIQSQGFKMDTKEEARARRKEFGRHIQILREQQNYLADDGHYRQWTQTHLAVLANLTERQIGNIERGDTVNLLPFLENLARAFSLTSMEKEELYHRAGYAYPHKGT